jgi:hypothetical protein
MGPLNERFSTLPKRAFTWSLAETVSAQMVNRESFSPEFAAYAVHGSPI